MSTIEHTLLADLPTPAEVHLSALAEVLPYLDEHYHLRAADGAVRLVCRTCDTVVADYRAADGIVALLDAGRSHLDQAHG